jgi:RNA polymerase sigma factor (sigma-70 family)
VVLPPFQTLVDAYEHDVARLAAALAGQDGADVAQNAWLSALRAYPSLKHGRNLRGWLLTITARAAVDEHRARARRAFPLADPPERPAPSAELRDDELWQRVRRLPERQRAAVALRYALDMSHAEVATTLGCTETTSRRLVSDALAALRQELEAAG